MVSTTQILRLGFLVVSLAITSTVQAVEPQQCASIEVDAKRLACYDGIFRASEEIEQDPHEAFGAEQVEQPKEAVEKEEPIVTMTATVRSISKPKGRPATITLDNDQVWHQVSFRYIRLREGDAISIRPSRFGGYILANERGVTMRVRRTR